MLRLGIDPEKPYRATFICQDGLCCCNMALISFRLFWKNLGNLPDFFGQMVYRPPWQKISRTPMLFGHVPMELSFLVITFLKKARSEKKVQVKETGKQTCCPILPRQKDQPSNHRKTWRRDFSFEEFMHSHGHKTTVFVMWHYRLFVSNERKMNLGWYVPVL